MHKLFSLYLEYIRESRRPPGQLKGGVSAPPGKLIFCCRIDSIPCMSHGIMPKRWGMWEDIMDYTGMPGYGAHGVGWG